MLSSVRFSRLSACLLALSVGFVTAIAPFERASAQTAPTLLPYTINLLAGSGIVAYGAGATCPSGLKSTDAYGDGCLATEIQLNAPRFVTTDKNNVVFFSDTGNNLVRRIDPSTGVITVVAGGATSTPASGATCGTAHSMDARGDGCLSTSVKLGTPEGLAFSLAGDLYVAENGNDDVRKIAAPAGGFFTATSGGGIITSVTYNTGNTYGYNVNNTAAGGVVQVATSGYLNFPYGIAFDLAGNLYVADEGNNALEVINLNATSQKIQGFTVPAGSIQKFIGYGNLATTNPKTSASATSGDCPDFQTTTYRGGCYFGSWKEGAVANASNVDSAYDLVVDPSGNVYFANEFNDNVGLVSSSNIINNYAGVQGSKGTTLTTRAAAGSFAIGSNYNVTLDPFGDLYTSDAVNGTVWRVDASTKQMYVVAGGASSVCATSVDAVGNGCPATQAKLSIGTLNGSGFATKPGVAGLTADAFSNLYVTDATTSQIRVVSTGAYFGPIGASQPTQKVTIHFAAGDGPAASGAYTLTAGTNNFTLGSASCNANSDNTMDCQLSVTATPSVAVNTAFTGTLQVTSKAGGVSSFPLGGIYVQSPNTRTGVTAANSNTACGSSTVYSTSSPVILTATVSATGTPTGTITFQANGNQIGTPQTLTNGTASLSYTFTTAGNYAITAIYSGDSYYKTSSGQTGPITTSAPTFSAATNSYKESSVTAGGTALYSFNLTQNVYSGSISFACSGLPAGAACVFNPVSISATGCSATNTVAMSITTRGVNTSLQTAGVDTRGKWPLFGAFSGCLMIVLLGAARRRGAKLRFVQISMLFALLLASSGFLACGKSIQPGSPTPSGTSTVTVTATGSTGSTVSTFTVPLTVN